MRNLVTIKDILIGLLLYFCAAAVYAWAPELGEIPKPLSKAEYVDGTPIDLVALKGSPVVIYFGADWCVPCTYLGRPAVQAAWTKYKNNGLKIIFVSMDDNSIRPAKIIEARKLGFPIAMAKLELCPPTRCLDGLRDQGEFGKVYSYPSAIVLDSDGIVRSRLQGGKGIADGLERAIADVLPLK